MQMYRKYTKRERKININTENFYHLLKKQYDKKNREINAIVLKCENSCIS